MGLPVSRSTHPAIPLKTKCARLEYLRLAPCRAAPTRQAPNPPHSYHVQLKVSCSLQEALGGLVDTRVPLLGVYGIAEELVTRNGVSELPGGGHRR